MMETQPVADVGQSAWCQEARQEDQHPPPFSAAAAVAAPAAKLQYTPGTAYQLFKIARNEVNGLIQHI
jgi:hypothetical protein